MDNATICYDSITYHAFYGFSCVLAVFIVVLTNIHFMKRHSLYCIDCETKLFLL